MVACLRYEWNTVINIFFPKINFRYDHYATLCELLPAALPSLAYCLQALRNGKFLSVFKMEISLVGYYQRCWVVCTRKLNLRGSLEMDYYTEFRSLSFSKRDYFQWEWKLVFLTKIRSLTRLEIEVEVNSIMAYLTFRDVVLPAIFSILTDTWKINIRIHFSPRGHLYRLNLCYLSWHVRNNHGGKTMNQFLIFANQIPVLVFRAMTICCVDCNVLSEWR